MLVATAFPLQHDDRGKLHTFDGQCADCEAGPVHGHPLAWLKQVRVLVWVPHRPQMSEQGPNDQGDHVPPEEQAGGRVVEHEDVASEGDGS